MYLTALAFDYGSKKIGVAVGQTLTKTATPLCIISSKEDIEPLIKSWKPNLIIVGMPYNTNGSSQEITKLAQNFADDLQIKFAEKYNLKIITVDERYTSLEAKQKFIELRKNKLIKQGENLDAIAAAIILERWLQTQN